MGVTALSEAAWTAFAAMFAAFCSLLSAVLVTLLRVKNSAEHAETRAGQERIAELQRMVLDSQARTLEIEARQAQALAMHTSEELRRYAAIIQMMAAGFGVEIPDMGEATLKEGSDA